MLTNQEPDRNIEHLTDEDLTNEQRYAAIHYLESHSESNEKQEDRGGRATAIILLILMLGLIALVWLYR